MKLAIDVRQLTEKKMKWRHGLGVGLALAATVVQADVDDRGNTATQGPETWLRAAVQMAPRVKMIHGQPTVVPPLKVELSHLMDPAAPQSGFAASWSITPTGPTYFGATGVTKNSSEAIFGHAGNSEIICGEIGQQGAQMDALGHFGFINQPGDQPIYFGGLTQSEVAGPNGLLNRLGIDKAEPIVTTVVLLDAAKYLNNGAPLPAGYAITATEIEAMLAAEGLASRGVKPGDVVVIHTGYGVNWQGDPANYYKEGPGLAYSAAVYFGRKRVVLVGLDNPFTDAADFIPGVGPFPPAASWARPDGWLPFGVHHHHLTQAGVHQIQNLNLTEMAEKKIYLGAIFILPIRFKGAAGSPVRPIVIGHPQD